MSGYRLLIGLALAIEYAFQRLVVTRLSGTSRALVGYLVSLGFLALVAEFATLGLGRRLAGRSENREARLPVAGLLLIASTLLVLNLFAKALSPYFATQRRPPPTIPLLVLVGSWVAMVFWIRRRDGSTRTLFVALAGLVLGTRVLVLWVSPFDQLTGDMLPTIDRALDELLAARFPYVDFPPPMPYPPATFLAYLPPKLLGLDLRWSNLALDVAAVAAAVLLAPGALARDRRDEPRWSPAGLTPDQWALPFLMLHPVWVFYGVNTQFSSCVLAAVLLGRAVTSAGPRVQALALALAVGSNPMLGACGPILFGHWLGRRGLRRALGLVALSIATYLGILAPFLLWNPERFLDVAFLRRGSLSMEQLSGGFTLFPLLAGLVPHATMVSTLLVLLLGMLLATRSQHPEAVVTMMALGFCGALLLQPVSFPHYFLPVLALAAIGMVPRERRRSAPVDSGAGSHRVDCLGCLCEASTAQRSEVPGSPHK